jgi:PmbA protein
VSAGLERVAERAVAMACDLGAAHAECTLAEGDEFSVNVRLGEVESLKDAGSSGAGLRVLLGRRAGSSYTSDLSEEGVRRMVEQAMEIAEIATEDPHAGLPDRSELGRFEGDLKLFFEDVAEIPTEEKIARAKETENAAMTYDARIVNSEGASFDSYTGVRVFANSLGFTGSYASSSCSLSASPVARDGGSMERDYWYTSGRSSTSLEDPEYVGQQAARRALRRLGPRRVETQKIPVIFEPRVARGLLDHLFDAVSGSAVYRKATFLADKLGEQIASPHVTAIDNATMPGLFGSSPFDDEGVPSRRTVVLERGVLKSFLHNTYTARRLGMQTTGNASRGLTGNAGVGHGNFYLEPGERSAEEIIRGVSKGLYVTELIGFGVNVVTGDYSRGAAGLWIENGELAWPVSEITIASTLQEMLMGIDAVGSDLEFRGALASPTLLVREMTISGRS